MTEMKHFCRGTLPKWLMESIECKKLKVQRLIVKILMELIMERFFHRNDIQTIKDDQMTQ